MSLPRELDFDRDREASPARMNRAMTYLYLRLAAATALQPEFRSTIDELQKVGLDRLNEILAPVFTDAESIASHLAALRTSWLTGEPLTQLLADLSADIGGRLSAVDDQLAANLAAAAAQLAAQDQSIAAMLAGHDAAVADQLSAGLTEIDARLAQVVPATLAEARSAAAGRMLTAAIYWLSQSPVALVDAAVIAIDMSAGINFEVTLGGNRTLGLPSNLKPGQRGFIRVRQPAAGGYVLAYASGYRPHDDAMFPALNTAANAVTLLRYAVTGAGEVTLSGGKAGGAGIAEGSFYRSNRWYSDYRPGQSNNQENNRLWAAPFIVRTRQAFNGVGAIMATVRSGFSGSLGVYASAQGLPTTLLAEGSFSLDTAGEKVVPIALTLDPGIYFLAVCNPSQYASFRLAATPRAATLGTTSIAVDDGGLPVGFTTFHASNALPSTFPGSAEVLGSLPFIALRAA